MGGINILNVSFPVQRNILVLISMSKLHTNNHIAAMHRLATKLVFMKECKLLFVFHICWTRTHMYCPFGVLLACNNHLSFLSKYRGSGNELKRKANG